MDKILSHPLTVVIVGGLAVTFSTGFVRWLHNQFKILLRKLEMNHLELKAMDYALEKSFKNGYSDYKAERLKQLIEKSKFVNADDFK